MILRRFYDEPLAQASYLIGCGASGTAVVVDPNRDVAQYLQAAKSEGVAITAVTETHIHADFVSGTRELAARTGAQMYLSAEGGADWQYRFGQEPGVTLVREGDLLPVGNVRLEVRHTPGHTPEHISFLVTDGAAATSPMGIVTGDFVFVGDVGRPDLLEKAAHIQGSAEIAARTLFRSLQRFAQLPDHLQIWPGHGAGSACGKGLSAVPQSTVGYERLFNWAFGIHDEAEFVRAVLADQPEPPKYFAEMKRINRDGPSILGAMSPPRRMDATELPALLQAKAVVVDTRPGAEFAAGHLPGSISIPLNGSFVTWAGWLLPYDAPIYLLVTGDGGRPLQDAIRGLAMIGLDTVAGYFTEDTLTGWTGSGHALERVRESPPQVVAGQLSAGSVTVIDVRGETEWKAGHLPGVANLPLGYLTDHLAELPRDRPVVLHCQGGGRAMIGASLLQAHGFQNVINLQGGITAWKAAGLPVEAGDAVPAQ